MIGLWPLCLARSISKACRPIIVRGLFIPYFIPCLCIPLSDLLMTRETTLPTLQYCLHAISLRTNIPSGNVRMGNPHKFGVCSEGRLSNVWWLDYGSSIAMFVDTGGCTYYYNVILLVGGDWNMAFVTFHILGMSSSQLTKSYFSEG